MMTRFPKLINYLLIMLAIGLVSLLFSPIGHEPKQHEPPTPAEQAEAQAKKQNKTTVKSAQGKGRVSSRIHRKPSPFGEADSFSSPKQGDSGQTSDSGVDHRQAAVPEMAAPTGSALTQGHGDDPPSPGVATAPRTGSLHPEVPENESGEEAPVPAMGREEMELHLQQIAALTDAGERQTALRELSQTLGQQVDLDLAAQALASLSQYDDQALFAREMVVALLNNNNPASAALLISQTGSTQLIMENAAMIGNAWGAMAPQAALEWAATLGQPQAVNLATNAIVYSWAERDLTSAYDWVAQVPDQQLKNDLLVRVGRAMAENDPVSAVQWAAQLADQQAQSELMSHALQLWAVQDMAAATGWIDQMPTGATREQSLNAVARQWASTDPAAAINWVTQSAAPESVYNILGEVASVWSRQEPETAAKWVATLPDAAARTQGIFSTTLQWARTNPAAAMDWVSTLPPDQAREQASASVLNSWGRSAPQAALAWVDGMRDSRQQQAYYEIVAGQWLSASPTQAAQGIANSKIPAEIKAKLLR